MQPTRAYFGQKDAAQCVLIRRLVEDLDIDVKIHVQPTIREHDGLAMSSRNAYLADNERKAAPVVYRALSAAKQHFDELEHDHDNIESTRLDAIVRDVLLSEPLVTEVQYVSIDDTNTMRPLSHVKKSAGAIVSMACKIGKVRLIDNILLR